MTELPADDQLTSLDTIIFEVKRIIVGQEGVIERLLACLLARGHALLEGVPGLAKTLLAESLAASVGGTFKRIQFTPDLLPADVTGTRIYRASQERFDVERGPVFANIVLADEINRAPAKVQSALLEVMAERQVTIGTESFQVPQPFMVMATQNPIESEGVYALPEAQQDRFLMKILVGYPTPGEEMEIAHRMGVHPPHAHQAVDIAQVAILQSAADAVYVDPAVAQFAVNMVVATRQPRRHGLDDFARCVSFGASPRATLGLLAAARALALLRRRRHVLPQDVVDIAPDVLRHRLVLSYEALAEEVPADRLITSLLGVLPIPYIAPSQHPTAGTTQHAATGDWAPAWSPPTNAERSA